ncbi:MAG: ATP-binding protein [Oligoflexus sp.]
MVVTTFLLLGINYGLLSIGLSVISLSISYLIADHSNYGFSFSIDSPEFATFTIINYMASLPLTGIVSFLFARYLNNAIKAARQAKLHSDEQARDTRAILDSINQAVFTIAAENQNQAIIGNDYSPKLFQFVPEQSYAGQDPISAVFAKLCLSDEQLSIIRSVLSTSLNELHFQFETNRLALPSEANCHDKVIEIEWSCICNQDDEVVKILVSLRDITKIRGLERVQSQKEEEIRMLIQITSVSERNFSLFIQACHGFLQETLRLLAKGKVSYIIDESFRNLHTVKGLARSYGFTDVSKRAHEIENRFHRAKTEELVWQSLVEDVTELNAIIERYKCIARERLGRDTDQKIVNIEMDRLQDLCQRANRQIARLNDSQAQYELADIIKTLKRTYAIDLKDALYEDILSCTKMCKEMGKGQLQVEYSGEYFFIKPDKLNLFKSIFIHIFRNAVDHGIQTESQAKIHIESNIGEDLTITIWDDGNGLDLRKIKDKAIAKNLIPKQESNLNNIVATIFESGLSTKDVVTDISGRGVGLDAVKNYLAQNQGSIEVKHEPSVTINDAYCNFQFIVKLPLAVIDD